jgi:hypothetical protein
MGIVFKVAPRLRGAPFTAAKAGGLTRLTEVGGPLMDRSSVPADPERLGIESVDALPADRVGKVVGDRPSEQLVFAVDAGNHFYGPPLTWSMNYSTVVGRYGSCYSGMAWENTAAIYGQIYGQFMRNSTQLSP